MHNELLRMNLFAGTKIIGLAGRRQKIVYLKRFKKRDQKACRHCGSPVDNVEYTIFFCGRRGVARGFGPPRRRGETISPVVRDASVRWSRACDREGGFRVNGWQKSHTRFKARTDVPRLVLGEFCTAPFFLPTAENKTKRMMNYQYSKTI